MISLSSIYIEGELNSLKKNCYLFPTTDAILAPFLEFSKQESVGNLDVCLRSDLPNETSKETPKESSSRKPRRRGRTWASLGEEARAIPLVPFFFFNPWKTRCEQDEDLVLSSESQSFRATTERDLTER